jgi:S1-C subfamily serine protease
VVQVNVEAIQTDPFGDQGLEQSPFAPHSQDSPGDTQGQQGVGSGVIYREDGYLITNYHVVEGRRLDHGRLRRWLAARLRR